jgi:hypothetical protein
VVEQEHAMGGSDSVYVLAGRNTLRLCFKASKFYEENCDRSQFLLLIHALSRNHDRNDAEFEVQ